MIQENEIIMLVLGLGVLVFMLVNYSAIKRIISFSLLTAAFYVLIVGWTMTILEAFFWQSVLNFLEHISYALSAVMVAVWFWRVFAGQKEHG